jgi:hypothetical protein
MHYDPRLIVQVLQFLWGIYSGRRSQTKPNSDNSESQQAPAQVPDPDKLQELIEEVEARPAEAEADVTAAIEEKFSPSEAHQVKEDFATLAVLVSPPNFADYDFFGVIEKYVGGMHTVASRADLFRLSGAKLDSNVRMLPMAETALALAPDDKVDTAVYRWGEITSASVKGRKALLLDGSKISPPLVLFAEGIFMYASYGIYSSQRTERAVQAYKLRAGQERNWLEFSFDETNFPNRSLGFREFEYRLNARYVKAILTALKADIVAYLRELEQERPVLLDLRQELEGLSRLGLRP